MSEPGRSPLARLSGLAKRAAPYAIAVAALGWVLHHTDLHQLAAALTHAPIVWFVVVSAVMLFVNCAADTFAMGSVFKWFGCRIPYFELYIVRASTYLLAIVNYHVGQAAIVGYLYRARKVPLLRATGWILFIIGINVATLFLLASAGASNATGKLAMLRWVPVVCAVGIVAYAALLLWSPSVLANRRLLAPLFEMGIVGHLKAILVRLPHIGVLLVWHFVSLWMFDVHVPPLAALLYLPAYFAVGNLPINVNGLGVAQLVAVAFFSQYAVVPAGVTGAAAHHLQEASVMAYSLSTAGISILLQLALGFACLRRGTELGLRAEAVEPLPESPDGEAAPVTEAAS